jgi:hypothetical protein
MRSVGLHTKLHSTAEWELLKVAAGFIDRRRSALYDMSYMD